MKVLCILTISMLQMGCISTMEQVNKAINDAVLDQIEKGQSQHHKRHSREHQVLDIHATLTDETGKETKLEFKKDGTLEKSGDSGDTTESQSGYTKRQIAITNCITGVITATVGAGVVIAVKYGGDCK